MDATSTRTVNPILKRDRNYAVNLGDSSLSSSSSSSSSAIDVASSSAAAAAATSSSSGDVDVECNGLTRGKKHLAWDEDAIEEHDLLRGTRMKVRTHPPRPPPSPVSLSHYPNCHNEKKCSFGEMKNIL